MSSPENCLVLSLAHRSLNSDLVSELIDRSASTTLQLLHEKEATSTCDDTINRKSTTPHPILHVHVSGSTSIPIPGRSHTDWQRKWSVGEWTFSWLVDKIGIQYFHSTPKPGQPRFSGRLVDVNLSGFSTIKSQHEKITEELTWIAINTLKHFRLKSANHIDKAVLVCPFGEEEEGLEGGMGQFVEIIHNVFHSEWTEKDGPLNGVQVKIETVTVPKEEPSLESK